MRRSNLCRFLGVAAVLLLQSWLLPPSGGAAAGIEVEPALPLRFKEMERLLALDDGQHAIAVVSFQSRVTVVERSTVINGVPQPLQPTPVSATRLVGHPPPTLMGQGTFKVDGRFALEAAITKTTPFTGDVQGEVDVDRTWGGDATYRRLLPLVREFSPEKRFNEVLDQDAKFTPKCFFVAVGTEKDLSVFENEFIGPVPENRVKNAVGALRLLHRTRADGLSEAEAVELLKSENACLGVLGLARLGQLEKLTADHFFTVMQSVPDSCAGACVQELLACHKVDDTLADGLARFVRRAPAARQELVLDDLGDFVRHDAYGVAKELAKSPALHSTLEELVEERAGLEQWANAVAWYQVLLRHLGPDDE